MVGGWVSCLKMAWGARMGDTMSPDFRFPERAPKKVPKRLRSGTRKHGKASGRGPIARDAIAGHTAVTNVERPRAVMHVEMQSHAVEKRSFSLLHLACKHVLRMHVCTRCVCTRCEMAAHTWCVCMHAHAYVHAACIPVCMQHAQWPHAHAGLQDAVVNTSNIVVRTHRTNNHNSDHNQIITMNWTTILTCQTSRRRLEQ